MTGGEIVQIVGLFTCLAGYAWSAVRSVRLGEDGYLSAVDSEGKLVKARAVLERRVAPASGRHGVVDDLVQIVAQVRRWQWAWTRPALVILAGFCLMMSGASQRRQTPGLIALEIVVEFAGLGLFLPCLLIYRRYRNPRLTLAQIALAALEHVPALRESHTLQNRERLLGAMGSVARALPRLLFRIYGASASTATRQLSVAIGREYERRVDAATQRLILEGSGPEALDDAVVVLLAVLRLAGAGTLDGVGDLRIHQADKRIAGLQRQQERRLRYAAASAAAGFATVTAAGFAFASRVLGHHIGPVLPSVGPVVSLLSLVWWTWRKAGELSPMAPEFSDTFEELADRASRVAGPSGAGRD